MQNWIEVASWTEKGMVSECVKQLRDGHVTGRMDVSQVTAPSGPSSIVLTLESFPVLRTVGKSRSGMTGKLGRRV